MLFFLCGSHQPPDNYDSSFLLPNTTNLPDVVLLVMDLRQEEMAAEAMSRHPFQYGNVIETRSASIRLHNDLSTLAIFSVSLDPSREELQATHRTDTGLFTILAWV